MRYFAGQNWLAWILLSLLSGRGKAGMKFCLALLACLAAGAASAAQSEEPSITAPAGANQFCLRNPAFCQPREIASAPASAMAVLERVNRSVNNQIVPVQARSDDEKREANRDWRVALPGEGGNCVEYAWTKFMLLAWEGIPTGAMRFAQVRVPGSSEFHALLLVRIQNTEVAMDNLTPIIWPADKLQYEWVAVQNPANGWQWIKPADLTN